MSMLCGMETVRLVSCRGPQKPPFRCTLVKGTGWRGTDEVESPATAICVTAQNKTSGMQTTRMEKGKIGKFITWMKVV
jgi:hypothetical protein